MSAEARANFPTDLDFYQVSIGRLIEFAEFEGNSLIMFDSLQTALTQKPDLIAPLIGRSVQIAQEKLDQDRTQNCAVILPFETALRMVAYQEQPDLLYPSRWNPKLVIDWLTKKGNEVAELAGVKTIGRNLPSRATWMVSVLDQAGVFNQTPFFIELGAAAGFILDSLKNPARFRWWLQSTNIPSNDAINNFTCTRTFDGFGVDLTPINDTIWAVACLGDDEAMDNLVNFLEKFPQRSKILAGDIANDSVWEITSKTIVEAARVGKTPVIIASEMLYLLSPDKREKVLGNIQSLIKKTNGYFLRSDSGQNLGLDVCPPELEMLTIGELRNPDFQLTGPRLGLFTKYSARWEKLTI